MPDHPTIIFHKDEMPILYAFIDACHVRGLNPGLEVAELMHQQLTAWEHQTEKEKDHV